MPAHAVAARWVVAFACATVLPVFAAGPAVAQPPSSGSPSSGSPSSGSPSSDSPTSGSPSAVASAGPTPPPLPADRQPPPDDGDPGEVFQKTKNCVQSLPSAKPPAEKPWGQDVLRFRDLSSFATGRGVKVAVIDTGVANHAYFGDRLTGGGDYVVQGGDGLEDCDGHGTEVAGIIAAATPQEIGFRGIAPEAQIVSIRQTSGNYEFKNPDTNQTVSAGTLKTLAKSIVRAADTDGVRVMNISINNCRSAVGGMTDDELDLQAALRYAVEQRDVVVVASAGNFPESTCSEQNGPDPQHPTRIVYPCWFSEYVMCAAAMTKQGELAEFSLEGPWVSVAAPGTEITSLDPGNPQALANRTFDDKGKPSALQGTSFSAPYVSGLAALVRQHFPNLTAKKVMYRIKTTAAHPAATGGHDNRVGYGMINPIAALTAFLPAEKNLPADKPLKVPYTMPPTDSRDWAPLTVAMIGTGGGLGVLLLTLFVVHTARRNREH